MGFYFRKSFKAGPARVNVSKSGVGWSVGAKGFRFGHRAGSGRKRKASGSGSSGFVWKLILFLAAAVALLFIVKLAIELVKTFWPWLVGACVLIAAGFILWRIRESRRPVDMSVLDQFDDDGNTLSENENN